jgi:hypothetical protein
MVGAQAVESLEPEAEEGGDPRRLRRHREERHEGRGRGLVGVRDPEREREHRDLEAEADQDEQDAELVMGVAAWLAASAQNVVPVAANRMAMPRTSAAEETPPNRNILRAPSGDSGEALLGGGQRVERHRQQLEGDEQGEQLLGGDQRHPSQRENRSSAVVVAEAGGPSPGGWHRDAGTGA